MMITIQLDLQISGAVYMGLDWKTHWHGCCPPTLLEGTSMSGNVLKKRSCFHHDSQVSNFFKPFFQRFLRFGHPFSARVRVDGWGLGPRSIDPPWSCRPRARRGTVHIWLVVDLALWKIWVTWDDIPNIVYIIYYSHFFSKVFQTTNQIYACVYIYIYIHVCTWNHPGCGTKIFRSRHGYPKDGSRYGDSESDPKTDQNLIEISSISLDVFKRKKKKQTANLRYHKIS